MPVPEPPVVDKAFVTPYVRGEPGAKISDAGIAFTTVNVLLTGGAAA